MKPNNRDLCVVMAAFQYNCRNERLMWQWLFEWATWGEDMGCFVDARMPVFKPRKPKRKWKNLSKKDLKEGNDRYPAFPIADVWNEGALWAQEKLKEKNQ